ERPPPFPECSSTNTIRNRDERICRIRTKMVNTVPRIVPAFGELLPALDHRGTGDDGPVLQREVAGGHLARVVRRELGFGLRAQREARPRTAWGGAAARRRGEPRRDGARHGGP